MSLRTTLIRSAVLSLGLALPAVAIAAPANGPVSSPTAKADAGKTTKPSKPSKHTKAKKHPSKKSTKVSYNEVPYTELY